MATPVLHSGDDPAPAAVATGPYRPTALRRLLAIGLLCGVLLLMAGVLLAAPDEKSLYRERTQSRGSAIVHPANPRC